MGQRVYDKAEHYIKRGNRKRLKLLLKRHPELLSSDDAMLLFSAIWRNQGMVQWLLDHGVLADTRMGHLGNTPLMQAAAEGDALNARLLLKYGADPNALNDENENPLGFAVTWKQTELIEILVDAGADVNNMDDSGPNMTQLDLAECSGWQDVCATLRSLGAKRYNELRPNAG